MNVYSLDIYLDLKYYASREKLLSQEIYWEVLEILAYARLHQDGETSSSGENASLWNSFGHSFILANNDNHLWKLIHLFFGAVRKFFDTWKFLKHRRVPLRIILVLWDQNFMKGNRGIYLLCIDFFAGPKFLKHWRVALWTISVLWDKKYSKKYRGRHPPMHKSFDSRNIFGTAKVSPGTSSGTVTQQTVDGYSETPSVLPPPHIHKIFRYQKFPETQKSPYDFFSGNVKQQTLDGKSWYPLYSLLSTKFFFDTRTFRKHIKVFCSVRQNNFEGKLKTHPSHP